MDSDGSAATAITVASAKLPISSRRNMCHRLAICCILVAVLATRQLKGLMKATDSLNLGITDITDTAAALMEPKPTTRPSASTDPDPNEKTIALTEAFLRGGFRNQAMRFTAFIMQARDINASQVLLPSVRLGDGYGGGKAIMFDTLFDTEHWNSFYPELPRFVTYNSSQHYQWDNSDRLLNVTMPNPWKRGQPNQFRDNNTQNRDHPYSGGGGYQAGWLWNRYKAYTKDMLQNQKPRDRLEVLIYKALAPSELLRSKTMEMMSHLPEELRSGNYLTLHARIESDMQKHPIKVKRCNDLKTFDLRHIVDMVEEKFKDDPPHGVFIPLSKRLLLEGAATGRNALAAANVATLERIEKEGMWGGRARVFELGSTALNTDPRFDDMQNTAGSVINFFLALNSRTFIGTPISTYSVDVWTNRYFRGKLDNYYYTSQSGLVAVANDAENEPEPYFCATG